MGEDSIDKALRRVQSVPWTFGMVGLATWLVVDLLRGGAAFDDPCNVKSRVTVTALMLLIAIGGWQLGRGIGGWYGAVVRSGTALMFAIKVTDIVVNSPFLDGGHSIGFARADDDVAGTECVDTVSQHIERLRAAIAKATGVTP